MPLINYRNVNGRMLYQSNSGPSGNEADMLRDAQGSVVRTSTTSNDSSGSDEMAHNKVVNGILKS